MLQVACFLVILYVSYKIFFEIVLPSIIQVVQNNNRREFEEALEKANAPDKSDEAIIQRMLVAEKQAELNKKSEV